MGDWGKVIHMSERSRLGAKGEVESWYRYESETKLGTPFTLEVRDADATPEKVKLLLAAKAQRLDATRTV